MARSKAMASSAMPSASRCARPLSSSPAKAFFEHLGLDEVPEAVEGFLVVVAHVRLQHAPGGERAGMHGHDDLADLQLFGERARLGRAGPAEGHEAEIPRVDAALHRDGANRIGHLGVHDIHDALRHAFRREPEHVADALQGTHRRIAVERHFAAGEVRAIQAAEHEIGVGDRGLGATQPVTGGPRHGAGGLGGPRAWRLPPPRRWSRRPRR